MGVYLVDRVRSRYFLWMSIALAATVFVGFSRTWFLKQWTDAPVLPPSVHLHALASTAWIVLFATQARLVDRRNIHGHRALGMLGFFVALVMAASAFPAAIDIAIERRGSEEAIRRMALPFVVAPTFLLLVCLAIWYRKRTEYHKRFMLLATIQGVTPALGRLPLPDDLVPVGFVAGLAAFLIGLVVYDFISLRRIHAATLFGIAVIGVSVPARLYLGRTEIWENFAPSLIG